jgi:pimeloyl-ACP methyl ester carboxylesterase
MKARRAIMAAALGLCLAVTGVTVASAAMSPDGPVTLQELRAKYGQRGSKYMTIKGVEVHYMDEGSGPAILMIHGSNSNLKTYDKVAAALKGRYRVIRYDIPPGGLSGPVSDEAMKELVPEQVPELLLTNLGIKKVTAVGVSSGGTTAMFFTARRPDMVERLIMSNSPSSPVEEAQPKQSKVFAEQIAANKDKPLKTRAFWNAFFDFFTGEPERMTPAMREQYFDMNRNPVKNQVALVAKVVVQPVTLANAAKVTCPVLLVWGARDPLLVPATSETLTRYLKNAQVSKVMLPDVGHYPPLEVPERFAQIVAAYIEAVTPVKPVAPPPADR